MKKLFAFTAIIIISFSSFAFAGPNKLQRIDTSKRDKYLEYKCIEEHRDETWDELRACIKEKRGKSLIYIEKHWEDNPEKKELRVQ